MPSGALGQSLDAELGRDVEQPARMLAEEMVVVGRIGVEIGLGALHRDLAQQAGPGELVQRVVDGRERHRHSARQGLLVQRLRRDVTVARRRIGAGPAPRAAAWVASPPPRKAWRPLPWFSLSAIYACPDATLHIGLTMSDNSGNIGRTYPSRNADP